MTVLNTNINRIDALLLNQSWTGTQGVGANITYAFGRNGGGGDTATRSLQFETDTFAIDRSFEQAVKSAMGIWGSYANVRFTQVPPSTNFTNDQPLMIALTNEGLEDDFSGVTLLYDTRPQFTMVDVIIGTDSGGVELARGRFGFFTVLHELGHALGLEHPFEGATTLPVDEDNWDNTIMSYTQGTFANVNSIPGAPMLYDIAAIQYLYGVNRSTNGGNDRHVLTDGQAPSALWDGGGTDTLDSSGYAGAATIDLREGNTNVNRVGSTATWVAFGANIENAVTGAGSDNVSGNELGNTLTANSGNDTINGYGGADVIQANQGTDSINGGQGNDSILGGKDTDTIFGGQGNDDINGNIGNDSVSGDAGDDTLRGGQGADSISGGAGNDILNGDRGSDTLTGGSGNDIFVFDTIQNAVDVVTDFVIAEDDLRFSPTLFATVDDVLAAAMFSGSTETITLIGGGSVILQNLSAALTTSDILIG